MGAASSGPAPLQVELPLKLVGPVPLDPRVLEVLYFSDKDVKRKLFERVDRAKGLLLVTATRQGELTRPVDEREPFSSLEREHGDVLGQVIVADEGTVEGMWRDPVGDLADALFPNDRRRAYAVASGYAVLKEGAVAAVVAKMGSPRDDAWLLQEALSKLDHRIPAPEPARRPSARRRKGASPAPEPPRAQEWRPPATGDPWQMLGIEPGTPLSEAKRAFRALIAQYHPDKVAHLASEFRQLAEERTRQILAAWEQIEALYR
jgi:DnaJ-domain-containing protein 1